MAVALKRAAKHALAAGALLLGLRPALAAGGGTVPIVVLKEHGVGNQMLAQPYLDRMVALAAKQNGWASVNGKYFTNRAAAEAFIKAETPHYGILSLPAFLALRGAHQLDVIGKVEVSLAGGRRYYLISKTADDLTGCKGQQLATDHAADAPFIDAVVLGSEAKLADFTLVPTRRPLQTIRALLTGEAVCALIDDAQKKQLDHLRKKDGVRTVWESAELPPMPVVAFPAAPEAERNTFKKKLDEVCEGDGNMACVEVGIDDLSGADAGDYAAVVSAYGE